MPNKWYIFYLADIHIFASFNTWNDIYKTLTTPHFRFHNNIKHYVRNITYFVSPAIGYNNYADTI